MYQVQFTATNSADWAQAIELIDATTNQPLALPDDAEFELTVRDRWDYAVLSAKTEDDSLELLPGGVLRWRFPFSRFSRFAPRTTFPVGLTMTTAQGTVQIFIGTLSFIDGYVQ